MDKEPQKLITEYASDWGKQWEDMNNEFVKEFIAESRKMTREIFKGFDLTDKDCDDFGKEFLTFIVMPWHFDKPIDFN